MYVEKKSNDVKQRDYPKVIPKLLLRSHGCFASIEYETAYEAISTNVTSSLALGTRASVAIDLGLNGIDQLQTLHCEVLATFLDGILHKIPEKKILRRFMTQKTMVFAKPSFLSLL